MDPARFCRVGPRVASHLVDRMPLSPQITVLMTVYNTPVELLTEAIDSIFAQTFRDFELLILDDGSTTQSTRDTLAAAAGQDPRVRVCWEPHRGLTPTLNEGLRQAAGEWIARHDADDWSAPERLEKQAAYLRAHPETVVVGSDAWMHRGDGAPLWRAHFPQDAAEIDQAIWNGNPFVHGSVLFRKAAALEAGGYREVLRCSQDYDFFWRLSEGGKGANLPEPLYHYRFTRGSVSAAKGQEQAIAHTAARALALKRRRGQAENVSETVLSARRVFPKEASLRAALKQADHQMLAGEYWLAARAYLGLLRSHALTLLVWAKLLRLALFRSLPPARRLLFGMAGKRRAVPPEPGRPRPHRVLFVIPGDGQGASMIFARRQAESLRAKGTDVDCFFLRSRTAPLVVLQEFRRFRSVLAKFRPDVVHAHYGTVTALFCALGAGRTPFMITFRGSDLNLVPTAGIRGWVGRLFSQIAALRAQSIICVSAQLRDRLWWRKESVIVMPSGVDAQLFRPLGRFEARLALGWPQEDRVVVFYAGRDPRNKREDLALASVEEARKKLPGLRIEVLRGATDPAHMPAILNGADCLLVTSDSEGSPTVVQEALACALPIVSVDVGDIRQRLEGVDNALVADRAPCALAGAILELTRVPLRTNGRDKLPEISLDSIARELQGLYGSLARA